VHGSQQLSLVNAHYDEHCFLPTHVYEAESGKPVAVILRTGRTPGASEVRAILKHITRRLSSFFSTGLEPASAGAPTVIMPVLRRWPGARRTASTTSSGWPAYEVLDAEVRSIAEDLCLRRAQAGEEKRRTWTTFPYAAKS
jgi:Transposase DDE domain group 1